MATHLPAANTEPTSLDRARADEESRKTLQPTLEECITYGERHGPDDWRSTLPPELLVQRMTDRGEPQPMIVMAGDIRKSTFVMKEALAPRRFALTLSGWIHTVRSALRKNGGWFEKFLGDGFLAYWIAPNDTNLREVAPAVTQALHVSRMLLESFPIFMEQWRENSRNVPSDFGLSIGLDAGPGYFTVVENDLTIVGTPVVGAVRMVSSATAGQILANVQFGRSLESWPAILTAAAVGVERVAVESKEYEGQEAYSISPV